MGGLNLEVGGAGQQGGDHRPDTVSDVLFSATRTIIRVSIPQLADNTISRSYHEPIQKRKKAVKNEIHAIYSGANAEDGLGCPQNIHMVPQ